ncbi:heparinase II/III domain-containing protein [Duganella sp. S19_KUP01_CR8]|uniref:heparinase II/III domain-containing protein n=1 Tax=Duganella sp. S19_KUP01_CR8 TaxID=3025502 RepID=UPI002FCD846B
MRIAPLSCFALLAGIGLSCNALAIPGSIKPVHPRLYATQTDIEQLKQTLPHGNPFPQDKGKIEFTLTAAPRTAGDPVDAMLLGTGSTATNAIMIRHVDNAAAESGEQKLRIQIALIKAGGGYFAFSNVYVRPGEQNRITLSYDSASGHVEVSADKAISVEPVSYKDLGYTWQPGNQRFDFQGRRGDIVTDLVVRDGGGNQVWGFDRIDYELGNARTAFLTNAAFLAGRIKDVCVVSASPAKDPKAPECDVATGSRNTILEAAKTLGLAYKLTGDPQYLEAARKYVNVIFGIQNYLVGGEWSMNPRVAALGVIYDWFYTELDAKTRADIRSYIRKTIRADNLTSTASNDDLIAMICGSTVKLNASTTMLDCDGAPDISRFYIMGHHASAMTGAALGLLAIVDESTADGEDVRPMIDRIYTHLEKGLIPARDYISVDGGHQTMSAYNSTVGEMIERLIMWRRVLAPSTDATIAATKFEAKVVQPFIYAYRGDGSFPAGSDNFELTVGMPFVGYMSLAAAAGGDGTGTSFYQQYVKSGRQWGSGQLVWDTLYFPGARSDAAALSILPLSRHFSVAGNVFMRDSWDYANSTLLDFKSTSFISENHQHLDQNSFAVFRHAPLLVDSGIYDAYGSAHWNNYYYRTIAHNSLVVFDPNEVFSDGTNTFSNDGGQWFKNGQTRYPTMGEIKPGAVNALDGVTQYEEGIDYAFVTGNASKAYSNKLDQKDGFLRSIFYLRPKTAGGKTSILVFDRVHTTGLPATSLLHTVGLPTAHAASTAGDAGRVNWGATPNNFPLLVRNGRGMMTIEPLLPKNASISMVGGESGNQCFQVTTDSVPAASPYDCRFTVRKSTGNGQFAWYNYAPKVGFDKASQSDFGVWRLEIAAGPDQSASAKYQWFLNVLHVEDERPEADPTANSSVLLDSSDGTAAAVAVEAGTTVVFAKSSAPAAALRWKSSAGYQGTILVGGLQPSTAYVRSFDVSTQEIVLRAAVSAGPEVPRASRDGVLSLSIN